MHRSVSAIVVLALTLTLPLAAQSRKLSRADAARYRGLLRTAFEDRKDAPKLLAEAKKLGARYDAAVLRELLDLGPEIAKSPPEPRLIGKKEKESFTTFEGEVLSGLGFDFDGGRIEYDVVLPEGDESLPLYLLLDPGHGQGAKLDQAGKASFVPFMRNMAKQVEGVRWLVVRTEIIEQLGAGGLRGAKPEEEVLAAFDALMRDLAARFAVDPDRVYVAGLSQTGFWAWYLGRAQPQRWAGIVPMGAVTWQVGAYLDNFSSLPVYVLHGSEDTICPVAQPRATTAAMKEKGYPVRYEEIAGGAHDGRVWGQLGTMLKEAVKKKREAFPKRLAHHFAGPHSARCYWVEAVELEKANDGRAASPPVASLELEVDGQEIRIVKAESIKKLVLGLDPALLDLAKELRVVAGEKTLFRGKAKLDFVAATEFALRHADWKGAPLAFVTLTF